MEQQQKHSLKSKTLLRPAGSIKGLMGALNGQCLVNHAHQHHAPVVATYNIAWHVVLEYCYARALSMSFLLQWQIMLPSQQQQPHQQYV